MCCDGAKSLHPRWGSIFCAHACALQASPLPVVAPAAQESTGSSVKVKRGPTAGRLSAAQPLVRPRTAGQPHAQPSSLGLGGQVLRRVSKSVHGAHAPTVSAAGRTARTAQASSCTQLGNRASQSSSALGAAQSGSHHAVHARHAGLQTNLGTMWEHGPSSSAAFSIPHTSGPWQGAEEQQVCITQNS